MISSEFSGLSGEVSLPMVRPGEPLPLEVELDPPICASAPVARKRKAMLHTAVLVGKLIETSRAKQERHSLSTKIYYPHDRIFTLEEVLQERLRMAHEISPAGAKPRWKVRARE